MTQDSRCLSHYLALNCEMSENCQTRLLLGSLQVAITCPSIKGAVSLSVTSNVSGNMGNIHMSGVFISGRWVYIIRLRQALCIQ